MCDYTSEVVPFLSKEEIKKRANVFLSTYWRDEYPVDVEEICDLLDIGVIPIHDLKWRFSIDAYTTSDFQTIVVDEDCFLHNEARCRFSLAHELGHVVLHRKYYPANITDIDTCLQNTAYFSQSGVEFQANYFAGQLLVPRRELLKELQSHFGENLNAGFNRSSSSEQADAYGAVLKHFRVSPQVLARRLSDEFPGLLT